MTSNKLKVGVVGVGALGKLHTKFYAQSPNAELIGVFDLNSDAANRVAQEFNTKAFSDSMELAHACEALSLAVPAHKHFEAAMPLLLAGKHLLIEKPLATKVADGKKIVRVAKKKGLVLGVGHVERYNPAISAIEKYEKEARFIEIHRLAPFPPPREGIYPRGTEVGVVLDLMIHDLDILLSIVQSSVKKIDAVGMPILCQDEDIANARIRFDNGCIANITASRISQEYVRKFRIFLEDSYLSLDLGKKTGAAFHIENNKITKHELEIQDSNALKDEIEDFIACATNTRNTGNLFPMKVSGEEALAALELAEKIIKAIRQNAKKYPIFAPKPAHISLNV